MSPEIYFQQQDEVSSNFLAVFEQQINLFF